MPGLVIRGEEVELPGLKIINYKDEPKLSLKMGEDMRLRNTRWVRAIVAHTTKGTWPQEVKPGLGPDTRLEERIARLWSTDHRHAGAHLSIDWDGTIGCHCDLILHAAYHAGVVNEVTVGFELYQGPKPDNAVYEGQLEVAVQLTDALTRILRIQRQTVGLTDVKVIPRMAAGGKDVVGVYGHRHVTTDRGRGDPGDWYFAKLSDAGYERFDYRNRTDRAVWKQRQAEVLGLDELDCDGIPGPMTCDALAFKGYEDGLWVSR